MRRRDLFRQLFGGLVGAGTILESGFYRAALARAMAPAAAGSKLFDIVKVAPGVFMAQASTRACINANSAIFVNSNDVLIVDTHNTPSATASLAAQIKKEITTKPVKYIVNTHFHDDHVQGNSVFTTGGAKVDFIAHEATKRLMEEEVTRRLKATLDGIPQAIERVRKLGSDAASADEKSFWNDQIRQFEAFQAEMAHFSLELPTITFDKSHVLKDRDHDIHIEFHGRAHTAGDVVVFCPQKKAVATGDMIHGGLPYMPDSYPRVWPRTIDSVGQLDFNRILPGHGPVMADRELMICMRDYLDELVMKVEESKKAGRTIEETQESITIQSMKSLQAHRYAERAIEQRASIHTHWGNTYLSALPFQRSLNSNTRRVYQYLDRL